MGMASALSAQVCGCGCVMRDKMLPIFWQTGLVLKSTFVHWLLLLNFALCDFLLQKISSIILRYYSLLLHTPTLLALHPPNSSHYAALGSCIYSI